MSKKEQIINAAKELFETYGINKISMNEIANKANVTKKTIYSYFKNKEELINYFITKETNNIKKMVKEIEEKDIPIIEKIHNIIMSLIKYKENSKILSKLTHELNQNTNKSQKAKEYDNYINNVMKNEIKDTIENLIEKNLIKKCDVEITAFIIYKIYFAMMFEWDKPLDKETISKNLKNILENGLFN